MVFGIVGLLRWWVLSWISVRFSVHFRIEIEGCGIHLGRLVADFGITFWSPEHHFWFPGHHFERLLASFFDPGGVPGLSGGVPGVLGATQERF